MKVTRQQVERFVAERGQEFGITMDDVEFVGMDTVLAGIRWGVVADTPEEAIERYFRGIHFDTAYWREVYVRRYGE